MSTEHRYPVDDHDELRVACHDGHLPACEALVRLGESEALRSAFLLTGRPDPARRLAAGAYERALTRTELGREFRLHLLTELGRAFLAGEAGNPDAAGHGGPPANERYIVETQRTRTLAALGRLDDRARLAIVLGDFNLLDAADISQVLGCEPGELQGFWRPARERLAMSIGTPGDGPLRAPLADASFDAPRGDLWPGVEDPLTAWHEQRRRQARRLIGAALLVVACLAATLAILLRDTSGPQVVALVPTFVPSPILGPPLSPPDGTPVPTPPPEPAADVPDLLLAASGNQVQPVIPDEVNAARAVQADEMPVVSPDGSQLFFVRRTISDDELRAEIVTLEAGNFSEQWTLTVAEYTGLTSGQLKTFAISLAATDDHVYIAWKIWQVTEPMRVLAVDRASGEVRGRWLVDLSGPITGNIGLYTGPHGSHLHILVLGQWPEAVGRTVYLRFALPEMRLERRVDPVGGEAVPYFFFWDSQMLPDGSGLYRVEHDNGFRSVSVRLFDFRSVKARNIDLPFESLAGSAMPFQQAVSNDGRWLYVLAPASGQLAIIDLQRRALDRVVQLDPGHEALPQAGLLPGNPPAWALGQTMRISADGKRLYAIGVVTENQRLLNRGIWVIDTTAWSLIARPWSELDVSALLLHGDAGRLVAVQPAHPGSAPQEAVLHVLEDEAARRVARHDVPAGWWTLATLADLYQAQYGARPAVDGIPPEDAPVFSSLPEIAVVASPQTIATGGLAHLEVRLLDPGSGELIQAGQPVRHDPDSSVTVILSRDGSADTIVVLGQAVYGRYQGVARLPDFGLWDARVVLSNGEAPPRQTFVEGVVAVDFPLTGTDGLGYLVRTFAEESTPRAGTPVTILAEIVSAGTGARISEDVSLYVGMPDAIDVVFYDPARGVRLKVRLEPVEHGLLAGQVTFRQPGRYRLLANAHTPLSEVMNLASGGIDVWPARIDPPR